MSFGADTGEHAPFSTFLDALFFVRNPLLLALWSIATIALCVAALLKGWRGVFVLAGALVALAYPHLWLVWMGGALEVARALAAGLGAAAAGPVAERPVAP